MNEEYCTIEPGTPCPNTCRCIVCINERTNKIPKLKKDNNPFINCKCQCDFCNYSQFHKNKITSKK